VETPTYHRLLTRQIKRFIPQGNTQELGAFLQSISEFYDNAQKERTLLEHTLDINSKELEAQNTLLKHQYEELKEKEALRNARDVAIVEKEIAIAANRAKDTFLSNMSHELRTPLNAINGFSQILLARPDTPEKVKVFIHRIYTSGLHLLSLVNTILDFAKIESGKTELFLTTFSSGGLIGDVAMLVETLLKDKEITLSDTTQEEVFVQADNQLIKQVLINLVSNAIKFSPDGGKILISCEQDGNRNVFAVTDHGQGIPADKIATLFDPFVQVREAQSDSIKGTGLGLSIVKKIVELHGGEVWIKSVVGEGSAFYFSLPIKNEG
jgi:signal transduction histidine kinase